MQITTLVYLGHKWLAFTIPMDIQLILMEWSLLVARIAHIKDILSPWWWMGVNFFQVAILLTQSMLPWHLQLKSAHIQSIVILTITSAMAIFHGSAMAFSINNKLIEVWITTNIILILEHFHNIRSLMDWTKPRLSLHLQSLLMVDFTIINLAADTMETKS